MNPMYRLWWDFAHNTSKALKRSVIELSELYSQNFKTWYGSGDGFELEKTFYSWPQKEMTMYRNNNSESPKGGRKTEDKYPSFKRVVSEGSTVVLDIRDVIKDIDNIDSIKHYLWKQTAGIPIVIDDVKDKPNFSFIAPYVEDNDLGNNAEYY